MPVIATPTKTAAAVAAVGIVAAGAVARFVATVEEEKSSVAVVVTVA